ncbi:MAG: sce7726 family protein [Candidatus Anammoxibacter sp.]
MKEINKIKINARYLPALGHIFTPVVIDSIAQQGSSSYLSEVCSNSGLVKQIDPSMPLKKFFDWIYKILFKNYRNEYIYKNAIANKILLGRHSLATSHMLTEFRVGKCKADVVVINGTSTVYEIKSEFDSFARLEKQIQAYLEIFDHVNVITSTSQATKLDSILPNSAGILVLTDRNTITTIRESKSNKKNTNPDILFDSLRKTEYVKVIKEYFGAIPEVPNTQIYKVCKKLFYKIPPEVVHDLTIKILRKRSNIKVLQEFIENSPSSLTAYAMSICSEKAKMHALMSRFSSNIGSVLIPKLV